MFALFGILPTWFISFRTVQKSQVSVQRYSASHDLGITTEIAAASFFDSIRLALSNSVGHDLDENEVEHGLCKTSCFYAADPKENRKAMYLVPGQPLFHIYNRTKMGIERCNIDVMSSSNEITDLYRKTLLTTFPCKDEYNRSTHSSLSNICEHGSISSIMSTVKLQDTEVESFIHAFVNNQLYKKLFAGCMVPIEFDLSLPSAEYLSSVSLTIFRAVITDINNKGKE